MKIILCLGSLFLIGGLLGGCAKVPPQRTPLPIAKRATIHSTLLLVNTTQRQLISNTTPVFRDNGINPDSPPPSGAIMTGGGDSVQTGYADGVGSAGLIGAAIADTVIAGINSHRHLDNAQAAAKIRAGLGNFNFIQNFKWRLADRLREIPWLNLQKTVLEYNLTGSPAGIVNQISKNCTLFAGTTYSLNDDFQQLEVGVYLKLYKKAMGNKKPKLLYANNFFYLYRLKGADNNQQQALAKWSANHAAFLKQKLNDAMILLPQVIARDIEISGVNTLPALNEHMVYTINNEQVPAVITAKRDGYWVAVINAKNKGFGTVYVVNPRATERK